MSEKLQRAGFIREELGADSVSQQTLYRMAKAREIRWHRIGRRGIRFLLSEVREDLARLANGNGHPSTGNEETSNGQ